MINDIVVVKTTYYMYSEKSSLLGVIYLLSPPPLLLLQSQYSIPYGNRISKFVFPNSHLSNEPQLTIVKFERPLTPLIVMHE